MTNSAKTEYLLRELNCLLGSVSHLIPNIAITHIIRDSSVVYAGFENRTGIGSEISDHYFGVPVKTPSSLTWVFGEYYTESVGALDFQCDDIEEVFKLLCKWFFALPEHGRPRQLLLEQKEDVKWIHISNLLSSVYSDKYIESLNLRRWEFAYVRYCKNTLTYEEVKEPYEH